MGEPLVRRLRPRLGIGEAFPQDSSGLFSHSLASSTKFRFFSRTETNMTLILWENP